LASDRGGGGIGAWKLALGVCGDVEVCVEVLRMINSTHRRGRKG